MDESERSGDHRGHQRRGDDREQHAQAAGSTPCSDQLAVLGLLARAQEVAIDGGQRMLAVAQLERCRKARAPIDVRLVTTLGVPGARRRGQLTQDQELFPVLCQPLAEPGPLTDDGLVRDLGRVVADDDEPRACQALENALVRRQHLGERNAPSSVVRSLPELGEANEQPPHDAAVVGRTVLVHPLGGVCDRAPHAAGGEIALDREDAAVAAHPGLVEGV